MRCCPAARQLTQVMMLPVLRQISAALSDRKARIVTLEPSKLLRILFSVP